MTSRGLTSWRFWRRRQAPAGTVHAPWVNSPDPAYLQPGTKIGAYEVVGLVGYGGFGFLYRVTRDSRPYALKISKWRGGDLDPEERVENEKRLDREISALMSLRHQNIVRVHGFERWPSLEDGYPYFVMDFIEGDHLNVWRKKTTPSLRAACDVVAAIADALGYIHRCGIFHRDLKSENVLVRRSDGSPVIVDFGISRLREADPVTRIGYSLGTITHYAPEYAEFVSSTRFAQGGSFEWRAETDLHSLGYVFYELLTGHAPFPRPSRGMGQTPVLHMIRKHVPAPPSVRTGGLIPASLDEIVMRLLAKDPRDRFASGDEVALAIRGAARSGGASWDAPLQRSEHLSSAPTPRWSRPPPDVVTTPRWSRPPPDVVTTPRWSRPSPDAVTRAPAEGAPAIAQEKSPGGPPMLTPAAPRRRRAARPILIGMGALSVVAALLTLALLAKPSQHAPSAVAPPPAVDVAPPPAVAVAPPSVVDVAPPSVVDVAPPSVVADDGAQAPAAPTASRPAPPATDAHEGRPKQDGPVSRHGSTAARPAVASIRAREERLEREREGKLARDRKAKLARDRKAQKVAQREPAAHEAAAREDAGAREPEAREAGLAEKVDAVVSSAQGSFEQCVQSERESNGSDPSARKRQVALDNRRVTLRINVQPDGKVTYPTFDDVTLRETELGSCLVKVAKRMAFPAFKGDVRQVDVSVVLRE
jgi:serine/threonine-protein kinase